MKCSAKVLKAEKADGKFIATLQFNGKLPKEGDLVKVKWGKTRSLKQNSIYWLLLTWYIEDGGMQDMGYMTPEELHEAMKGRFLIKKVTDKKGILFYKLGSTTELTADEFMKYIEKVEKCVSEYCGISSQPFWQEYAQNCASE